MRRYQGDPRWIDASRYPGECRRCSKPFAKGASIFYYPKGKATYGPCCAQQVEREFLSEACDEDAYGGYGNPYAS